MISVIIVSLNTKNDFLSTIKSIISQTKKVEIIVVDGDSKDGTIDIINQYSNFFEKVIIEKDQGIYFAMNKGIKLASNEWIHFLNSGDIFFSDETIKNVSNILRANKTSDVVIGNSYVKRKKYLVKSPRSKINNYTVNSCFSHQSSFTKKNLLDKHPLDTQFKYAADFDFYLKLYKLKKKFLYIDQQISINKDGGISDLNRIKVLSEFKKIINLRNKKCLNIFKINLIIFYSKIKEIIKLLIPNFITEKIIYLFDKRNKN